MNHKKAIFGFRRALTAIIFLAITASVFALAPEEKQPPAKQTRTLKFFIFQNPAVMVSGTSTTTQFSLFIGEQSPVIKSAHIEISGVSQETASQTITADINETDSFPTSRAQSFALDVGGEPSHFNISYNGSATQTLTSYLNGLIISPGSYSYYLKINISGANVSALQAQLIITYQFTPVSDGNLPATGELTSAVFDTFTTAAALQGPAYNSIMWKGTEGTGKVRFQLATSDCPNGATDYPTCSTGAWSFKGGSACSSGDWYDTGISTGDGGPEKPVEISCAPANHNNQRYFKYKIQICSSTDCSTAGNTSPIVSDVVVNWAP